MPLTEEMIHDLSYYLSKQYQDDPIDQITMQDSLIEEITAWAKCYGEHVTEPVIIPRHVPVRLVCKNGMLDNLRKDDE